MLHQVLIPPLQYMGTGICLNDAPELPKELCGWILNSKPDLLWVSHSMRSQYFSISPCEQRGQTIIQSYSCWMICEGLNESNGNKTLWWNFKGDHYHGGKNNPHIKLGSCSYPKQHTQPGFWVAAHVSPLSSWSAWCWIGLHLFVLPQALRSIIFEVNSHHTNIYPSKRPFSLQRLEKPKRNSKNYPETKVEWTS